MPRPFSRLTRDEFADLLGRFPFSRRITAVHLHHTWRPRQVDFVGLATIEGMWRFHTETMGWSDIAQHLTIDPEGGIWTGRSFNRPPVSAKGFNGVSTHGPFMIEVIGDFDEGRESLSDAQKKTVLEVLARLHVRHGLHPETLCFHNQMSGKTCPGSSVSRDVLVQELASEIQALEAQPRGARRALPFGEEMTEAAQLTERVTRAMVESDGLPEDPADAELGEEESAAVGASRGKLRLTEEILDKLRPHVVNLRQGAFSDGGLFENTSEDVDALVHEHMKAWFREHGHLRVVLYAHGGLTSEKSGLRYAYQSYEFWKDNGVYPVFFVWETGLGETIAQLLRGAREKTRGRRDLFDFTSDPLIEVAVRALGAVAIWGGMKRSAERAAAKDGGGTHLVKELRKLRSDLDLKPSNLSIHAVGHSAGSIFHSELLPRVFASNGPRVESVHFLAPAVTVDLFKKQLAAKIGRRRKIRQLVVYTMRKRLEKRDHCAGIYRKSLLYLVHRAIEAKRMTPLLGLEKSLRADSAMVQLFGLGRSQPGGAEVIWSTTAATSGRHASQSTRHGDFNNDPATMNSVLRRVLGLDDQDPISDFEDYPAGQDIARGLGEEPFEDLLDAQAIEELDLEETPPAGGGPPVVVPATPSPDPTPPPATRVGATGRRRALCVGIDAYPTAPLAGCINDSRTWASVFRQQGFEVIDLVDGEATRDAILGQLESLVRASEPGDVLLFQYAGHGTTLPDLDGDELDGQDEAFVPYDYQQGAFLLDDDLGKIWDAIPHGVNVTTFIDCCHSGTLNRMLPGGDLRRALHSGPRRARFLPVTDTMVSAHREFRRRRGLGAPRAARVKREVHFAACQDDQSAWESNGQGDFTGAAAPLLASAVAGDWSHEQLQDRIRAAFAGNQRQQPHLVVSASRRDDPVLAPVGVVATPAAAGAASVDPSELRDLLQKLLASLGNQ